MKWERIGDFEYRAKVFGGWLVQCIDVHERTEYEPESRSIAIAFVPDPNHEWNIEID